MFVISMIVQGVIIRLQFIVYAGFDSGIDISHIDKKKKFFRSKLSFFAFQAYLATVVWGFINMYWLYALLAMFAGLFLGGRIVTKGNFKNLSLYQPYFDFSMILICIYLWVKWLLWFQVKLPDLVHQGADTSLSSIPRYHILIAGLEWLNRLQIVPNTFLAFNLRESPDLSRLLTPVVNKRWFLVASDSRIQTRRKIMDTKK